MQENIEQSRCCSCSLAACSSLLLIQTHTPARSGIHARALHVNALVEVNGGTGVDSLVVFGTLEVDYYNVTESEVVVGGRRITYELSKM